MSVDFHVDIPYADLDHLVSACPIASILIITFIDLFLQCAFLSGTYLWFHYILTVYTLYLGELLGP